MSSDVLSRNELTVIDESKPYASYVKTILGRVGVTVWDRFTQTPAYVILSGDPHRKAETAIVDVWNQREDSFLRRNNKRQFEKGILIPYTRPENVVVETPIEQFTDEQLKEIVNSKFLALQNRLNKIQGVPVLFRMINIAEDLEKSSKITDAIKARISEIQLAEYGEKLPQEEE
jgi:hypothetical protein